MSLFRFGLVFVVLDWGPPLSYVRLKTYSREGNQILITLDCCSAAELEWQIDKLIDELRVIKRRARRRYRSWKLRLLDPKRCP